MICTPSKECRSRRSRSPVTMYSALPAKAHASTARSSGSRNCAETAPGSVSTNAVFLIKAIKSWMSRDERRYRSFKCGREMASFSSRRRGRLVTRSKCPTRQASNTFAGVPRGVINPLMRILVSRTALGTPTPTAPRGGASDKAYGLSGVLIRYPSRFRTVFCPHPIEHGESAFTFGGE